jgi:glutaconate CoA-transferase subunit B
MYLEKIHPGVDLATLKASVQWDLAISPNLTETELPTEEQVMIMRTIDPLAVYLGNGRQTLSGDFETFMKMFEDSYQPMVNLMRSKGMI